MTPEEIAIERVIAAALSLAATRTYQDSHEPGPYDDAQMEMDRDILMDALHAWAETTS